MKVIIVEDEENFRLAISGLVSEWGYDVESASDIETGWSLYENTTQSCVLLLDYILAESSNGLELARRIKEMHREAEGNIYAHIILITGAEEENLLDDAAEVGVSAFISKPKDDFPKFKKELKFALETAGATIELHTRCLQDEVTGILVRKAIEDRLEAELSRAGRDEDVVAIILFDLDHFKKVNDQYGHKAGDEVLRRVVNRTKRLLRRYDLFGRYGGEEFLIVLPKCDERYAVERAELIRDRIEQMSIRYDDVEIRVTVSIGVAVWHPTSRTDYKHLLQTADLLLYEAKKRGRNLVQHRSCGV